MLNSISVPILIKHDGSKETIETLGLLDSGVGGQFIDQNYAKKAGFEIKKLDKPLRALNVDGMRNNHLLCRIKCGNQQKADEPLLISNRIGEAKDYPWLPLAA